MKYLMLMLVLLVGVGAALAEDAPDYIEFQKILDSKCSKCHARARIDQALAEHRDMLEIQQRMIGHGAELNSQQRQVLGVFFRAQEVKDTSSQGLSRDPLAEYRSVVAARCSGCHSLEIIEKALQREDKFDVLAQIMIKRGAVLSDKDVKIIQTFWGEPLR